MHGHTDAKYGRDPCVCVLYCSLGNGHGLSNFLDFCILNRVVEYENLIQRRLVIVVTSVTIWYDMAIQFNLLIDDPDNSHKFSYRHPLQKLARYVQKCRRERDEVSSDEVISMRKAKKVIRDAYINRIQQDAAVFKYLFTAKSLYMFRVYIAPIIRST